MIIEDLQSQIVYLEDMDGLTTTGEIDSPTRITLLETDGETILSTIHYADFSGLITLELADILKELVEPRIPDDEWDIYDNQVLNLSIRIATTTWAETYSFRLYVCSRDAEAQMTDIDALDVPLSLPLPVTVRAQGSEAELYFETVSSREHLSSEHTATAIGFTQKMLYFDSLDRPFRICLESSRGDSTLARRTPIYRPKPGKFELYLFRNRFGAMELFPMSGDLQLTPEYKFEVTRSGRSFGRTVKSEDVTLMQFSGPLTRKASLVLAQMLREGCAYHYLGGEWRRIVIEETKLSLRSSDTLHKQSFSFRYQEPVDIRDIII